MERKSEERERSGSISSRTSLDSNRSLKKNNEKRDKQEKKEKKDKKLGRWLMIDGIKTIVIFERIFRSALSLLIRDPEQNFLSPHLTLLS
jgi:hypothetical protein